MSEIITSVHVEVEHFSGLDEDDVGYPYYVAHSPELHFTTDGRTFEELLDNIQECVQLCLVDGDSVAEFGVVANSVISISMN